MRLLLLNPSQKNSSCPVLGPSGTSQGHPSWARPAAHSFRKSLAHWSCDILLDPAAVRRAARDERQKPFQVISCEVCVRWRFFYKQELSAAFLKHHAKEKKGDSVWVHGLGSPLAGDIIPPGLFSEPHFLEFAKMIEPCSVWLLRLLFICSKALFFASFFCFNFYSLVVLRLEPKAAHILS